MPKPRRAPRAPQARAERTRGRLLEAARRLLAEGGPAAVTHRAVSERAGVSLGATTYYFGTKRELLAEVFRVHLVGVRDRVATLVASSGAGGPPPARARAAGLTRFLEGAVRDDRLGTLATLELALERAREPKLRARLRAAKARSDAYAAGMLRRFDSQQPDVDATLLIAVLNGLKLEWLAEGERSAFAARIPVLARRLAELFLPGRR
jgi:AcrR family transcriptional regulator